MIVGMFSNQCFGADGGFWRSRVTWRGLLSVIATVYWCHLCRPQEGANTVPVFSAWTLETRPLIETYNDGT